ncbi:P-loop containing nucleoside triphosphate hydrolase protein [Gongronella butleri]|nr:P-loop containing nucleoside triphosphate hydrolase protein [Gongronella butleri]
MIPNATESTCVRVAVRVRPMSPGEQRQQQHMGNDYIDFVPGTEQIVLGKKHSFTFDHVFAPNADQTAVYTTSVLPLVHQFLEGYNATVFAYGQTGSGKTYSMGIGLDAQQPDEQGILQRFVDTLFSQLQGRGDSATHDIRVSFLELHNEDLVDLLVSSSQTLKKENQPMVVIREDVHGNICWSGVREEPVSRPDELYSLLEKGSIARTTAATDMNISSSRSHAIFSVRLSQTSTHPDTGITTTTTSKFHFVDLAGSERLKRTNAVGHRAKEGISINSGLLALGNVISALGDPSRRSSHIPYRDAKLTRLLQDSLGGNSQTLMLACVSPAWSNHQESLNTLQYANRARNIRNRVSLDTLVHDNGHAHLGSNNSSSNAKAVHRLKSELARARMEIKENDEFLAAVNHEMDSLKSQVECMHQTIASLVQQLAHAKANASKTSHSSHSSISKQQQILTPSSSCSSSLADTGITSSGVIPLEEHLATTEQQKALIYTLQMRLSALEKKQQQQQQPQHHPTPPPSPPTSTAVHHGASPMMRKESEKKKKRHSYRFGSKRLVHQRSISSLRRRNAYAVTPNAAPAAAPRALALTPTNPDAALFSPNWKEKMASYEYNLGNDMAYLHDIKAMMIGHPDSPDIHDAFNAMLAFSTGPMAPTTLEVSVPMHQARLGTEAQQPPQKSHGAWANLLARFDQALERHRDLVDMVIVANQKREAQLTTRRVSMMSAAPGPSMQQQQQQWQQRLQQAEQQHRRAMDDTRRQYEQQAKKQQTEHSALKRQYQQQVLAQERARTQHNATVMALRQKLDALLKEKKKMTKKSKQDADRARERERQLAKQILQLERKQIKHTQLKQRLDRDLQHQRVAAKRQKDDMIALATQLQSGAFVMTTVVHANRDILPVAHRNLLTKAIAAARTRTYLIPCKKQISTTVRMPKKKLPHAAASQCTSERTSRKKTLSQIPSIE